MRQLLVIFSSFGKNVSNILPTSILSINSFENEETKKTIETATEQLSNLTDMIFGASMLKSFDKANELNEILFATDGIKAIIKDDIKIKGNKFTLKVDNVDANDENLVDKAVVTVSGKVKIYVQESDTEFSFKIILNDLKEFLQNLLSI